MSVKQVFVSSFVFFAKSQNKNIKNFTRVCKLLTTTVYSLLLLLQLCFDTLLCYFIQTICNNNETKQTTTALGAVSMQNDYYFQLSAKKKLLNPALLSACIAVTTEYTTYCTLWSAENPPPRRPVYAYTSSQLLCCTAFCLLLILSLPIHRPQHLTGFVYCCGYRVRWLWWLSLIWLTCWSSAILLKNFQMLNAVKWQAWYLLGHWEVVKVYF